MNPRAIIKRPIVTERATDLNTIGKYVFMVEPRATKNEVKKAIKAMYKVDVVAVNTVTKPGKARRFRNQRTMQSGYKKAIVTLKKGQKIDVA